MRYFIGLIKSIFRWSNIGTFIFFLLNAGIILALFSASGPEAVSTLLGVYFISLVVALSPIGEAILGFMSGARRMTRVDMRNKIEPLLRRVHIKSLEKTPELTQKINLKVMYSPVPNAFALGRRTICVNEGLLALPDDMIEGILAHEVGHLAYHHTDMQLLIGGGNFIITFVIFIFKFIAHGHTVRIMLPVKVVLALYHAGVDAASLLLRCTAKRSHHVKISHRRVRPGGSHRLPPRYRRPAPQAAYLRWYPHG